VLKSPSDIRQYNVWWRFCVFSEGSSNENSSVLLILSLAALSAFVMVTIVKSGIGPFEEAVTL
jgi:hypothetical protein